MASIKLYEFSCTQSQFYCNADAAKGFAQQRCDNRSHWLAADTYHELLPGLSQENDQFSAVAYEFEINRSFHRRYSVH